MPRCCKIGFEWSHHLFNSSPSHQIKPTMLLHSQLNTALVIDTFAQFTLISDGYIRQDEIIVASGASSDHVEIILCFACLTKFVICFGSQQENVGVAQ